MDLTRSYTGIILGKSKENIFIATSILKPIKITYPINMIPAGTDLDVGDKIEFKLLPKSTPKNIQICNISISFKGAYKESIRTITKEMEALPKYVLIPKTKVLGMCLEHLQDQDFYTNWIESFKTTFNLTPVGISQVILAGGKAIEENIIFESSPTT